MYRGYLFHTKTTFNNENDNRETKNGLHQGYNKNDVHCVNFITAEILTTDRAKNRISAKTRNLNVPEENDTIQLQLYRKMH